MEISGNSHSEDFNGHHEDMQTSLFEAIEILLTGSLTHTHEHDESEGDRHEHSHEHHLNGTTSSAVFLLVQVQFSFTKMDLVWQSTDISPDLNPFYAEIFKPPIFA